MLVASLRLDAFDVGRRIEPERASIFANHMDVLPTQPCKPFTGDVAQRGTEIDNIDCRERVGNGHERVHLLDIVASSPADLSRRAYISAAVEGGEIEP